MSCESLVSTLGKQTCLVHSTKGLFMGVSGLFISVLNFRAEGQPAKGYFRL